MKAFWDAQHQANERLYLTGSNVPMLMTRLRITDDDCRGRAVLDVGVGLGKMAQHLQALGCEVHCLDISTVALDRVRDFASTYADPLALPPDTFDLAICHLVSQHMAEADLIRMLTGVIASLKDDGMFALQFSISDDPANNDILDDSRERQISGGCCRTASKIVALVTAAGGKCTIFGHDPWPDHRSSWSYAHIRRC